MTVQELYNLATWVASSDPDVREETIRAIEKKLKKSLIELRR